MAEKILKVFRDENVHIGLAIQAKSPALKETVTDLAVSGTNDLQTDSPSIPPLEKRGKMGFESGLSPKYTSLRKWDGFKIHPAL